MVHRLLAAGLGLLAGGVLLVVLVHPGIALLRRIIGKDRCFSDEALNGCSTWGNGTVLCGFLAWWYWPTLGYLSVLTVIPVAVTATLLWTSVYCFQAMMVRKREFAVRNDSIELTASRTVVAPEFAISGGAYSQTGPGTGYSYSIIQIGTDGEVDATNVYIDSELADVVFSEVMRVGATSGCRAIDLSVLSQVTEFQWRVVHLNSAAWTPCLCGKLDHCDENDRDWWRQWCQPEFGQRGSRSIESREVLDRVQRLLSAYPELNEKHAEDSPDHDAMPTLNLLMGRVRTRDNVRALQGLLKHTDSVEITTGRAFREQLEALVANCGGGVEHSFNEFGVETVTHKKWNKK